MTPLSIWEAAALYCSDCVDTILKPVIEPDVVFPFTVLLLLPDDFWDGHPSDWVYGAWVMATDSTDAVSQAVTKAIGDTDRQPDDYATLAIFNGYQPNVFAGEG